jgi:hypothetical protein
MKRILIILAASAMGCYGLVGGPAAAGERWSADACKRLQELKETTYGLTRATLSTWRGCSCLFWLRSKTTVV